jgi:hypothetical protein
METYSDTSQIRIENIDLSSAKAQMFKLPQIMIDYLWERIDIAKKNKICLKNKLAGNISHSYKIEDQQDWFVKKLFNILYDSGSNPRMFNFINDENISINKRIGCDNELVEPYAHNMWVNFQKKGEFQPLHMHSGVFSFVVWMEIPYHYKDESQLPFARSVINEASQTGNFSFAYSDGGNRGIQTHTIQLSPDTNGHCCFFPSDLCHQVYPFYTSDKERISISGNIRYRPIKLE